MTCCQTLSFYHIATQSLLLMDDSHGYLLHVGREVLNNLFFMPGLSICHVLRSGQVEAVKIHHFGPGCHEVLHELLLRVLTSVNFSESPKL